MLKIKEIKNYEGIQESPFNKGAGARSATGGSLKENNGITLIALIITIILMLILASITVNVAINGGLFGYAKKAKDSTEIASEKETVQKANIIAEGTSKTGRITVEEMQKAIDQVINEGTATAIDSGETIVVKFNESNRYYEVDNKGNVEGPKELVKDEYAGDITKGGTYDGSESNPFQISCIEDLVAFSIMTNGGNKTLGLSANQFTNQYVELTRTLDFKSIFSYNDYTTTKYGDLNKDGTVEDIRTELTKTDEGCIGFNDIGKKATFQGEFDGKGNEIRKIYINTTSTASDSGLFYSTENATIKNLGTTGEIISGGYAGGIVCNAKGTSNIINCYSEVNIVAQDSQTKGKGSGGICGTLTGGSISNCYNAGLIEGNSCVGGIVGNFYGTIEDCYNEGRITSNATKNYKGAGGIAGAINGKETIIIKNCYNNGEIVSKDVGGGILGKGEDTISFTLIIANCYNLKQVNAAVAGGILGKAGSIAGAIIDYKILNCYNEYIINGGSDSRRNCG